MKNLILLASLFFATLASFACQGDRIITFEQLPKEAQQFVTTHFPTIKVSYVKQDGRTYEVRLTDGTEIEFSHKGQWENIDGNHNVLPQSIITLLPATLTNHISTQFPDTQITKIDKDRRHIEIELNNGLEMVFSSSGEFLRLED